MKYATIAALLSAVGLGGVAWWYHAKAQRLAHDNAILRAQNETCSKRIKNILEAQNDAREVDTWGGLHNVPLRWLLPEAGTGD